MIQYNLMAVDFFSRFNGDFASARHLATRHDGIMAFEGVMVSGLRAGNGLSDWALGEWTHNEVYDRNFS